LDILSWNVSYIPESFLKVVIYLKAIDVARGTNITPSVISRYLSGTNQPSRDNLFAVANYLGVSLEWLLSSSEAPESSESSRYTSERQNNSRSG